MKSPRGITQRKIAMILGEEYEIRSIFNPGALINVFSRHYGGEKIPACIQVNSVAQHCSGF